MLCGCVQALTAKMAEIKNQDMEEEVAQALIQLCVDTMLKVRARITRLKHVYRARETCCSSAVLRGPLCGCMHRWLATWGIIRG